MMSRIVVAIGTAPLARRLVLCEKELHGSCLAAPSCRLVENTMAPRFPPRGLSFVARNALSRKVIPSPHSNGEALLPLRAPCRAMPDKRRSDCVATPRLPRLAATSQTHPRTAEPCLACHAGPDSAELSA